MAGQNTVAAVWDDLYAYTGDLAYIKYADAVGFYWNTIPQYAYGGTNTFAIVLFEDGTMYIEYDDLDAAYNIAGFSCSSTGTAPSQTDLSSKLASLPYGAVGIGNGTGTMAWEFFGTSSDLEQDKFFFCGNGGTDGDGDGWTPECGDTDDADSSVYPYSL
jgi:hypothetical protein